MVTSMNWKSWWETFITMGWIKMSTSSKPKFRVVENPYDFSDIYDDFKEDYLKRDVTVSDMLEKYDISYSKYKQLRKQVAEETGVNIKPSMNSIATRWETESKYIDQLKTTKKYRVSKYIDGVFRHFGVYSNLDVAIYVRDRLIESNWSQKEYIAIRKELFGEDYPKSNVEVVYSEFKKDFLKGHTMEYLKAKYHLKPSHYKQLSKRVRTEERLVRKPQMSNKEIKKYEQDIDKF